MTTLRHLIRVFAFNRAKLPTPALVGTSGRAAHPAGPLPRSGRLEELLDLAHALPPVVRVSGPAGVGVLTVSFVDPVVELGAIATAAALTTKGDAPGTAR